MPRLWLLNVVIVSIAFCISRACGSDVRDILLEDVSTIASPGVPGPLCAFGDKVQVIVAAETSAGIYEPIVAAATWGRGRIVVFGHGGYFGGESLEHVDTLRLLSNAAQWVSRIHRIPNARPVQVATLNNVPLAARLTDNGFEARSIKIDALHAALLEVDVICIDTHQLRNKQDQKALQTFVKRGGGLLAAGLGWGWQQLHPKLSLVHNHPGNQLLAEAGILFADGYVQDTTAGGFDTSVGLSKWTHAQDALRLLIKNDETPGKADENDLAQAAAALTRAIQSVAETDRLLWPKLEKIEKRTGRHIVPSQQSPLLAHDALQRVLLSCQIRMMYRQPPTRIREHSAASSFPGPVKANALRTNHVVHIDGSIPDWHSTGVYAPPGEVIKITVPQTAVKAGWRVRIGAHNDTLWHKKQWKRVPEITTEYLLLQERTTIASPFGGLIYIVVPRNNLLDDIEINIDGAVAAPLFVLNKTDADDWRQTIRHAPSPWGELATDKIILTLPSRVLRDLDDPQALMRWWDTVLDAQADLRTIDRNRLRPERVVCDVQISAGYMHAGYPIMTHLDVVETFVDLDRLRSGQTWGIFHELGHNHQHRDWTFNGTGEVTCNIFTLYALQQCCDERATGHDAVQPESKAARTRQHQQRAATFDSWKSDPFLALIMYIQLQEAFGWDAYKRVFAEYEALPDNQRPRTEQDKRDQWMVRFSRTVNHNLGPFFQWWGVPTSEKARRSISDLPPWMPADVTKYDESQ